MNKITNCCALELIYTELLVNRALPDNAHDNNQLCGYNNYFHD